MSIAEIYKFNKPGTGEPKYAGKKTGTREILRKQKNSKQLEIFRNREFSETIIFRKIRRTRSTEI